MDRGKLLDNLARLGMPYFEASNEPDANETIAEVVKSRDLRLWEGFPVLLANAVKEKSFSYEEVAKHLKGAEKKDLIRLLLLALALYDYYKLKYNWVDSLKLNIKNNDIKIIDDYKYDYAKKHDIKINDRLLVAERIEKNLNLYFAEADKKAKEKRVRLEELSLEYAMSRIFTHRQKEILRKRLDGAELSKTEQEYYSRVIKKKVVALANHELHAIARKLLELA